MSTRSTINVRFLFRSGHPTCASWMTATGKRPLVGHKQSHLGLLRHLKRVVDLDAVVGVRSWPRSSTA